MLFSSRSLLFIGASLGPDRTVSVLQEVHEEYAGIRHFAIMKAPTTARSFNEKEQQLRNCGVLPLWYQAESSNEHVQQVEALVSSIVERISVQTIQARWEEQRHRPRRQPAKLRRPQRAPQELNAHFDRVVLLIEDGRLVFFLGSAVHHPTKLMAHDEQGESREGDLVAITECRRLSRRKSWRLVRVLERAGRA